MSKIYVYFILVIFINPLTLSSWKINGIFFESGTGEFADSYKCGVNINLNNKWLNSGRGFLYNYLEVSAGVWDFKDTHQKIRAYDYSITPVFRYSFNESKNLTFYVEGAVGFHIISSSYLKSERKLGSDFLFGDHLGIGIKSEKNLHLEFTYRFQHLSNADLGKHNQGINFHQVRVGYSL